MTIPEPKRKINAVLDHSAIQSYAYGHVHVGELISQIEEDGHYVGIPAAALAAAHGHQVNDDDARLLMDFLITLPKTIVLDLDRETARQMAGTLSRADGDVSRAHAAWIANRHGALYLTTEPDEAKHIVSAESLLPIPNEDA